MSRSKVEGKGQIRRNFNGLRLEVAKSKANIDPYISEAAFEAIGVLWVNRESFMKILNASLPLPKPQARVTEERNTLKQIARLGTLELKAQMGKCKKIRIRLQTEKGTMSRKERIELIQKYNGMKQRIRDSCAVTIQAAWRGYQTRRPVTSARDKSYSKLTLALDTIRKQRASYSRPQDVEEMSMEQLIEDKSFMKRMLNQLDRSFKIKNGRMPTKQEKEVYRPIYEEYRRIKEKIAKQKRPTVPEMNLQRLRTEKRALQLHLNKYEKAFISKHNRGIKFQRDIQPVKAEFERYQMVKAAIADLQRKTSETTVQTRKIVRTPTKQKKNHSTVQESQTNSSSRQIFQQPIPRQLASPLPQTLRRSRTAGMVDDLPVTTTEQRQSAVSPIRAPKRADDTHHLLISPMRPRSSGETKASLFMSPAAPKK